MIDSNEIIYQEISSLTFLLRKSSKWSSGSAVYKKTTTNKKREGEEILESCWYLQSQLQSNSHLSPLSLLSPYILILSSPATPASLTSLTLLSLTTLLSHNLIPSASLNHLLSTVVKSKFEGNGENGLLSSGEEGILERAIEVIELGIVKAFEFSKETGEPVKLSDELVCEVLEFSLSICCNFRSSTSTGSNGGHLLRRIVEKMVKKVLRLLFSKLKDINQNENFDDFSSDNPNEGGIQTPKIGKSLTELVSLESEQISANLVVRIPASDLISPLPPPYDPPQGADSGTPLSPTFQDIDQVSSYGLPSLNEIFRVLISLLNPNDSQHTDSIRLMSLRILISLIETWGGEIKKFESLRWRIEDEGCRLLFQVSGHIYQTPFWRLSYDLHADSSFELHPPKSSLTPSDSLSPSLTLRSLISNFNASFLSPSSWIDLSNPSLSRSTPPRGLK
jgi:hypothetical protein